jgi:hypothetical protein
MRRVVNWALLVVGVIFSVGIGAGWVRSYVVDDQISRIQESAHYLYPADARYVYFRKIYILQSVDGKCGFLLAVTEAYAGTKSLIGYESVRWGWAKLPRQRIPGQWLYQNRHTKTDSRFQGAPSDSQREFSLRVPYWAVWIPFLLLSAWGIWRRKKLRVKVRVVMGLCGVCGYDLRASTERCPECGTAIPLKLENANQPKRPVT